MYCWGHTHSLSPFEEVLLMRSTIRVCSCLVTDVNACRPTLFLRFDAVCAWKRQWRQNLVLADPDNSTRAVKRVTLAADTAAHCLQDGGADAKSTCYWRSSIPESSSHTARRHPTYTFSRSTTAQPTESVHRLRQTLLQLCRTEDLEQSSHWNLFLQLRSNFPETLKDTSP